MRTRPVKPEALINARLQETRVQSHRDVGLWVLVQLDYYSNPYGSTAVPRNPYRTGARRSRCARDLLKLPLALLALLLHQKGAPTQLRRTLPPVRARVRVRARARVRLSQPKPT